LTSGDASAMVRFEKRGWVDIATILYFRYRSYILVMITALLVGLVLVNYYRQRTRRNLGVIREQKEQLERAQRQLKEAQAKLVAQEKFRQARDIAGGFAHEIRNALSPARHALGRMMGLPREKLTEDKLKRIGGLMDRSLVHAVDLTERISEYTRIEELATEESVDLVKVCDRVLENHRHLLDDSGIEVVRSEARMVEYRGNPRHFELVFANLVRNAMVAMHESEQKRLTVSVEDTERRVVIEVADTGCGIRHEERERIWDIFYTTDPDRGTGVGLTLTKKIVDLYEGTISVTSEPGSGTVFRVELPR
ncbi:GHKL domain-containing protein, partial [candidate division GN15 bacterium]|nr:GHKL domain-containing protein [candidate division GN15 bacterium]